MSLKIIGTALYNQFMISYTALNMRNKKGMLFSDMKNIIIMVFILAVVIIIIYNIMRYSLEPSSDDISKYADGKTRDDMITDSITKQT